MGFIKYLSGKDGQITIPALAAVLATMNGWTLTRRAESGPDAALYDLHASFSFFQRALWDDPDFTKRVEVRLSKSQSYIVRQQPGYGTALTGNSLVMQGVRLEAL